MPTLGVVDQSPIRRGGTAAQGIRESLQLAEVCDRLGYARYWFAEHHSSGGLACASPEVLIPMAAARTNRIRVGSGGVMLSHYSPLKVAEQFRMLEAVYPGRIDLGVGRAPGSDTHTARALQHGPGALGIEHFPDQLMDLYGFLANDFPPDHPFRNIRAMPAGPTLPDLWVLGSSNVGAEYAAELGWAFSFAQFINSDNGDGMVEHYKTLFQPSHLNPEPRASIGVSVICASTHEEAEYLAWSRWGSRMMQGRGQPPGIPSPEDAMAFPYTEPELDYIAHMRRRSIYGSPGEVRDRLEELGRDYGVDEFMIVTITYDFAARVRSYELIAEEFGLTPAP